jgi:hypothetical protein
VAISPIATTASAPRGGRLSAFDFTQAVLDTTTRQPAEIWSREFSELALPGLESLQPARDDRDMPSMERWNGKMLATESPVWQPLLDLAPDHVDGFMWMFEVELEDGRRLHAYKHWWTRRYLHLAHDGRAFVYENHRCWSLDDPGWYREVEPERLLELVLPSGQQLADYQQFLERARQDSNLWPCAPEAHALSS